jgi:adenosylcobinamide kinase/adenosylcobinamide-phosphate guanylyltransferase
MFFAGQRACLYGGSGGIFLGKRITAEVSGKNIMILIIGGAFQGKCRAAREILGLDESSFHPWTPEENGKEETMQETIPPPEVLAETDCVLSYHKIVRRLLETGADPDAYTRRLIEASPKAVTMDEVGYGIVPMERSERNYREAAGRSGQMLASAADQVYRVICGIAQRIK